MACSSRQRRPPKPRTMFEMAAGYERQLLAEQVSGCIRVLYSSASTEVCWSSQLDANRRMHDNRRGCSSKHAPQII